MALISEELALWEIAFRWAERDPHRIWVRIPLDVRDHFRNLMQAILTEELACSTLKPEKWQPSCGTPSEFFIRHYIDEVYECIGGIRFDRKLLRWALIDRDALKKWCRRRGILPPGFWFPEGAKDFPLEEVEKEAELLFQSRKLSEERRATLDAYLALPKGDPNRDAAWKFVEDLDRKGEEVDRIYAHFSEFGVLPEGVVIPKGNLTHNQETRAAVQQAAIKLWEETPALLMDDVVDLVRKQCDAERYARGTVEKWVREVTPDHVRARKGPQRKKNLPPR